MSFYENFLQMCNSVGKTPSKVAAEAGISKSIVSRWKNGGGVTDATAAKIAAYFEVPLDALMDENNWEAFGLNLDYYMEGSGTSPEDLAREMDVEPSVVHDWLNRKQYPKKDMVEKIANYFALDKADFYENKSVDLDTSDYFLPPPWMAESETATIKKFLKLSPEQQKIISDTMDNFLKG